MRRIRVPVSQHNYNLDPENGDVQVRPRLKLLERQPTTAGRIAAFDDVHEHLTLATEFFQHHGDGGQYGVYRAMDALIDYFSSRGIPYAALRPLEAVMAAINDARSGVANPIFAPTRSVDGGRPPKPVLQLAFEGQLGIVMECCVRHCRAQKERPYIRPAAALAARMINESSWPITVTAKQLIEIRERIQQSAKGSPDRMQVDESMSSDTAKAFPLEWARALLSHEWVNPPPKVSG